MFVFKDTRLNSHDPGAKFTLLSDSSLWTETEFDIFDIKK